MHRAALARIPSAIALVAAAMCASAQDPDANYVYVDGFEAEPDCSAELVCRQPAADRFCVAGRLAEAGSGAPIRAFVNPERPCGDGAFGGVCALRLVILDALDFASNPGSATPLSSADSVVDGCGRFRFNDVDRPQLGFFAIVSDDRASEPVSDLHVPAAMMLPVASGQRIEGLPFVAVQRGTVERWTLSAGSPFGTSSFADVGALVLRFAADGVPAAGVTVTRQGATVPNEDFYFSDANPAQLLTIDGQLASTGLNGAGMVAGSGVLVEYSGSGGEPAGCTWPSRLGAAVPGAVSFLRLEC